MSCPPPIPGIELLPPRPPLELILRPFLADVEKMLNMREADGDGIKWIRHVLGGGHPRQVERILARYYRLMYVRPPLSGWQPLNAYAHQHAHQHTANRAFSDWLVKCIPHPGIELSGMSKILKNLANESVISQVDQHHGYGDKDAMFSLCDTTMPSLAATKLKEYVDAGGVWFAHCRTGKGNGKALPHFIKELLVRKGKNFQIKDIGSGSLHECEYAELTKLNNHVNIGLLTPNAHDYIGHYSDGENPLYASFEYGQGKVVFGMSDVQAESVEALLK